MTDLLFNQFSVNFFQERYSECLVSLDEDCLQLLNKVNDDLVIENENTFTYRNDGDKKMKRSYSSKKHLSKNNSKSSFGSLPEDWEAVRNFKTTKIVEKTGLDKYISEMRGLLNKISVKNYDNQKDIIKEQLDTIVSDLDGEIEEHSLFESMFNIMSSNSYLSSIYADLYVELVGLYCTFESLVDNLLENYKLSLFNIHYIDPSTNYDGFCEYNKINDQRKCNAKFIINLMKLDMVEQDDILNLLKEMLSTINNYIVQDGFENEVEEIIENMVLIYVESYSILEKLDVFKNEIYPMILTLSKTNVKENPSFTNRAKFKLMDCS